MEDSGETGLLEDDIGGTFDSNTDVGMGGGVGRELVFVFWQSMYGLFVSVALGTWTFPEVVRATLDHLLGGRCTPLSRRTQSFSISIILYYAMS